MAEQKNYWTNFDTPYQTQPPKGAAEGPINYGGIADIPVANDPLGVMPKDSKPRNIGPSSKE